MSKKFKFAAIQLTSTSDISNNLHKTELLVKRAAESGAKLIGLPENFAYMGTDSERKKNVNNLSSICYEFTAFLASKYKACVIGGGTPYQCKNTGNIYNRLTCFDSRGTYQASYDKINLFKAMLPSGEVYDESICVSPGIPNPVVVEVPDLCKLGFSICYDVRFPSLFQRLSSLGAELICVPAAFTRSTGAAHWHFLLRARAVENATYLMAPAQVGQNSDSLSTFGHSLLIDPWGVTIADAGNNPGFVIGTFDPIHLSEVRSRLPAITDRSRSY